jgi:hypothetical protein
VIAKLVILGSDGPKSGAWKRPLVGGGDSCLGRDRAGSGAEKRGIEVAAMRYLAFGRGCRVTRRGRAATKPPAASAEYGVPGSGHRDLSASEMGHLAERAQDAYLLGTEIDEYGDLFLDTGDPAETVHVVDDPVSYGEPLARWSDRGLEGAAGQMALGYS